MTPVAALPPQPAAPYEDFRDEWIKPVLDGKPSSTEKGRRFATRLIADWLDLEALPEPPIYPDGAGDGGVDAALFIPHDPGEEESGDAWYLVQSKYGTAFNGDDTLYREGHKVVRFLSGEHGTLNALSNALKERLTHFLAAKGPNDRVVLVLATVDPLTPEERATLDEVRDIGRMKLGNVFDVAEVSVATLHANIVEQFDAGTKVELCALLVDAGNGLRVGAVPLLDLYAFLKSYRHETQDLDRLYEKNVRRFLGGKGKVNKAMTGTLRDRPEDFGLFNNGVTIVATEVADLGSAKYRLTEPFVVNGCQTTRTLWETLSARMDAGGTGVSEELEAWKSRAAKGSVVVKVISTDAAGGDLLSEITRYTNSQNKVQDKDFLALASDFRLWAREMEERYGVFLEVQRGGWDSRRAWQKTHPNEKQLTEAANAADLLKVYAAGWRSESGRAFAENKAFLPGGIVFREVTEAEFGPLDLYAAYLLKREGERLGFGRGASSSTRSQTKFLFYFVTVELLRHILASTNHPTNLRGVSVGLIRVLGDEDAKSALLSAATGVVDNYMTPDNVDGAYGEPRFLEHANRDMNAFLKSSELAKDPESYPKLRTNLGYGKFSLGKASWGVFTTALNGG